MTPGSPSPRRLLLLGCLLATIGLSACGSDTGGTAESTPPTQPRQQAKASIGGKPCPGQVDTFIKALDNLRRQLAVGLSYEQYAARIESLGGGYDEIPLDRLTLGCLASAGTPTEQAFNKYIDAVNAWGECLADASCSTASIEPVLQRKWRAASGLLSEAR